MATGDVKIHEEFIDNLKICAESISDNAESIVGTEPCLTDVNIHIYLECGKAPTINIDRNFYPEGLFNK